jgi:hypothetical protein
MYKIKMKIVDWDETSMTLNVEFFLDGEKDSMMFSFCPVHMFDNKINESTLNEILKSMAHQGVDFYKRKIIEEKFKNSEEKKELFRNLKNKTFEYDLNEFLPFEPTPLEIIEEV